MGIIDKLKFWSKKESEFSDMGFGKDEMGLGLDQEPAPGMGPAPPGSAPYPPEQGQASDYDQYGQPPSATPPEDPSAFGMAGPPPAQPPPPAQAYPSMPPSHPASKDYEIISAKLDAVKAYLDTISQRLSNIENMMRDHEKRW